jgi:carbamoyltransferase
MKLLSISLSAHDTSMSYFDGSEVKYIKLERTKHVKRYPMKDRWGWMYEIKKQWGVDVDDIDEIVVEHQAKLYYDLDNLPPKIQDVLTGKTHSVKYEDSFNIFKNYTNHKNMWYIGHHYSHSLSTWMMTDKKPNLNIVIDGEGDNRTWSIFRDDVLIDYGRKEHGSIGGQYMRAARLLNIESHSASDNSGKLMGLQSFGEVDKSYLHYLRRYNITQINQIFDFEKWINFSVDPLVAKLIPLNWIATVHVRIGEIILELFQKYAREGDLISYSGGVAQNVVWNTELKKHYPDLIIPPHAADDGLTLGGLEFLRIKNNLPPFKLNNFPYSQDDVAPIGQPNNLTIKYAAMMLAQGKTVGWYQGNGEIGPRALGNRSILMDPCRPGAKFKVNDIKRREKYRPFGASVLKEHTHKYFDMTFDDDYMLYSTHLYDPKTYESIAHIDGSCRVQTVADKNPIFRKLLEEFYEMTGCAVLMNTSLNLAGKPLAGYPEIAKDFFELTSLDVMIIGNDIYNKETHDWSSVSFDSKSDAVHTKNRTL